MKIVINFKESLFDSEKNGKPLVLPRDIRNLFNSLAKEEHKDLVAWHKHTPSPIIYSKPFRKSVDVYAYNDELVEDALNDIVLKLLKIKKVTFGGKTFNIDSVWIKPFTHAPIQEGSYTYQVRTPVIYGSSKTEFFQASQLKDDTEMLQAYIRDRIVEMAIHTIKHNFGIEINESQFDDLTIFFHDDFKRFIQQYKEDQRFPAFVGTFTCNYSLPRFIGYKTGLGYGELRLQGNNKKRKGKR